MGIYDIFTFDELIAHKKYIGRGIVIGKTSDARKMALAYFISGRSENSRNRIFTKKDGAIFTEPFDASKVEDPSLIIYAALRDYKNKIIVTNGNHTDTIYEGLKQGKGFIKSLRSRKFEPDAPNYTPRISGIVEFDSDDFSYKISILKSGDEHGSVSNQFTFEYLPLAGLGHFIHTYSDDASPLPSFTGEPTRVKIADDIDEFTSEIWNALDDENRISIYTRFVDFKTNKIEDRIINKKNR